MLHCVLTDILEELTASIIRVVMMVVAASFPEMSVSIYQTTWCNIPEDSSLHTHCYESLKSHK
jgi:hypothetical protein